MPKKNTFPSNPQAAIIKANGLNPWFWAVELDEVLYIIVRNRFSGEFKFLPKEVKQ